jgi:hypothetical protein
MNDTGKIYIDTPPRSKKKKRKQNQNIAKQNIKCVNIAYSNSMIFRHVALIDTLVSR